MPGATLADVKDANCRLWANCEGKYCGYGAKLDLDALIKRYGTTCRLGSIDGIERRLKCSRCGHVGATLRLVPIRPDDGRCR